MKRVSRGCALNANSGGEVVPPGGCVSLSSPSACAIAPLLSARKRGLRKRALESPPKPKLLRLPESQVALLPVSYKIGPTYDVVARPAIERGRSRWRPAGCHPQIRPGSTRSHTNTTSHDVFDTQSTTKPGNFSDDNTGPYGRVHVLWGCNGACLLYTSDAADE